mmetsp:Transcript_19302/g.47724  ORF Transcript_19302/g.47724 Transcript_19302/m.47724 type:complete len:898 (+) Transcript_19302:60-2753(+)
MANQSDYGSIPSGESDETEAFIDDEQNKQNKSSLNCNWRVLFFVIAAVLVAYPFRALASRTLVRADRFGWVPTDDLGVQIVSREPDALPSSIWGSKRKGPLPTNSWYLNLVSHRAKNHPDESTKVYTVPYIIDTAAAGDMAGINVHWPITQTSTNNVQMVHDAMNAVALGTLGLNSSYHVDQKENLSALGVTLRWDDDDAEEDAFMKTHIVRGMPYATMIYSGGILPSLFSYNGPADNPVIDGSTELVCGQYKDKKISNATSATVQEKIQLHFINSDFTWMLFFSQPVEVECGTTPGDEKLAQFQLNVKSYSKDDEELLVRMALMDCCTTGMANIKQHCAERNQLLGGYAELIEQSSSVFPTSPAVHIEYPSSESENKTTHLQFDWKPDSVDDSSDNEELLMFAMPHHQEKMLEGGQVTKHCVNTFHGKTCLVKGSKWSLTEDLSQTQSFVARRPPVASAIESLASSLSDELELELPDNLHRGAADTYFSGKILSRVARTIVIASELRELAEAGDDLESKYDVDDEYLESSIAAVSKVELPSQTKIDNALEDLKSCVQVWLEEPEAPYLYDESWGGLVNCGCEYKGKGPHGKCVNTFPDCPALTDVNIDFGNGYYNDHHFHYGYHVYAAAVVAKYDPEWALLYFDRILLYIRDYANPWMNDEFFTPFRQKDWWMGSSWASGIVSGENSPHGRNQESSSEAIAAYESMALFGHVMTDIFQEQDPARLEKAQLVRDAGELLTKTEIDATNRYWHVWSSKTHKNSYPEGYSQPVVGMLYDTMASFQTWFSPLPLVSYGIQLMPFTAVGELRDDPEWAAILYPKYEKSCTAAGKFCTENGWDIIQAGLCATAGNMEEALDQAMALSQESFTSDGGSGNSLSNTIWYIATRPYATALQDNTR